MEPLSKLLPIDLLKSVEEHPHGKFKVRIEFYETLEGKHFVWPYIRLIQDDIDSNRQPKAFLASRAFHDKG